MRPSRALELVATLAMAAGCAKTRVGPPRSPAHDGRVLTDSEWTTNGVVRAEELFVGRFPGVRVMMTPRGLSVRIRGAVSVNGSAEPLYVIDGFPVEAGPDGLLDINPNDIATIEVLKDAASTAEYGMRGANGVVKITTKRFKG